MTSAALVRQRGGLRAREEPPILPGAPWVKVLRAGVCGTDLQFTRGDRRDRAAILGHEAVGAVEGDSGKLVVFNPVDAIDQDRILGHSYDGVFRGAFPLGVNGSDPELVPIPPGVPLELCALCEPVAAALFGWDLAEGSAGSHVGIWGAGPIGLIHTHLALKKGRRVRLVHRSRSRLDWTSRCLFGDRVEYALPGAGNDSDLDLAFVCVDRSGIVAALAEAARAVRSDGLIVLVGGVPRGYRTPVLPGADLDAIRRLNVSGRRGPGRGIVSAATPDEKPVRLSGHRGTSASQLLRAHREIAADRQFFASLVTHVVEAAVAPTLIEARCAHHQQDYRGAEIVKIVIRFGDVPAAL